MQIALASDDLPSTTRMTAHKLGSMTASGRNHFLQRWLAAVMVLLISVWSAAPVQAWPWGGDQNSAKARGERIVDASAPTGRLQEVSPPGAVQQLQQALNRHQPRLTLISPNDGSLLKNRRTSLEIQVEDWPLAEDPQLGLGAHVALQIDDQPPLRFSQASKGRLTIDLPELSPGSHRFSAYAAMPWGEAVKSPGASLQWRLDLLQELIGTQPEQDAPWLAVVSPAELGRGEPLLIDWLIWNAPLQNLREGDGRWRLRISVNGDSFLVDRQDALWLKGAGNGGVQMELLDGMGEPITPVFNNQFRSQDSLSGERPIWMQSKLSDEQIARLLGEAVPEPTPPAQPAAVAITEQPTQSEQPAAPEPQPAPTAAEDTASTPDSQSIAGDHDAVQLEPQPAPAREEAAESSDPSDAKPKETNPSKSASTSRPKAIASPPPAPAKESNTNAPTSSLGGSARELLNANGTQR